MKMTRKEFVVKRIEKIEHSYTVRAKTKKEAIRQVEEHEVDSEMVMGIRWWKPTVEEVLEYEECPNIGEGWTEVPLEHLEQMLAERPDIFDGIIPTWSKGRTWHYNGICKGEKLVSEDFCYHCVNAQKRGHRLLHNEEKKYLNDKYGKELNVVD